MASIHSGNLVDTEKIYEKIMHDLAKKYQKPYPWDVRMKVLGTTERRTCEIAVKELNLPCTVDDFHKQFIEICLKNLGTAYLFKGLLNPGSQFMLPSTSPLPKLKKVVLSSDSFVKNFSST